MAQISRQEVLDSVKPVPGSPKPDLGKMPEFISESDPNENLLFDSKFRDLPVVPAPPSPGKDSGDEGKGGKE